MKILVDTSVWIDHLHKKDPVLITHLQNSEVLLHPFIIGELSLGTIKNKNNFMRELSHLTLITEATHNEVIFFAQKHSSEGSGIGWIDVHLLASAALSNAHIYTKDKNFQKIADKTLRHKVQ